jgi:hypothetical protein
MRVKKIILVGVGVGIMLSACTNFTQKQPIESVKNTKKPSLLNSSKYILEIIDQGVKSLIVSTQINTKKREEYSFIIEKKPSEKIIFENGQTKIKFKVFKKSQFTRYPILLKEKDGGERLLGVLSEYYAKRLRYDFCTYQDIHRKHLSKFESYFRKKYKQESSHSRDWIRAWEGCEGGYIALKKDGSLWQFGEIRKCDWGQITGVPDSAEYQALYLYHLKPKKIGDGFDHAKMISRGNRFYAIKKDGTLWGWGNHISQKAKQISEDKWASVGLELEGHDCCNSDIGLKKDGTLWSIFNYYSNRGEVEINPIAMGQTWDKILIGCCTLDSQKRDGTVWRGFVNNNTVNFKESRMDTLLQKVPSGTIKSVDYENSIKPRKDGTLWLLPQVKIKEITHIEAYPPLEPVAPRVMPPPVVAPRFKK